MTKKKAQIGYEFLDASGNFIYEARETGKTHTPFASEILLFQSIKCGDLTGVKNALNLYRQSGLIIGHMSDNPSRKIHYWAVSTIAVAISIFRRLILFRPWKSVLIIYVKKQSNWSQK